MDAEPINDLSEALQDCELRYLRERDRALGLEQELLRATSGAAERELELKISQIQRSTSYKIGRFVTAPFRMGARVFRAIQRMLRRKNRARPQHTRKGFE